MINLLELLYWPIDFILHVDQKLAELFEFWGLWTYGLIFGIVFCETGLIVAAVLPGDSLLFTAGAMAALGHLDPHWLFLGISVFAMLGDALNYSIGRFFGQRLLSYPSFISQKSLDKTKTFFHKHGAKSIVLCRFTPIIRTFGPFFAGLGHMPYGTFFIYNVLGGFLWSGLFVYSGFYFGQTPLVQKNLTFFMLTIVTVSLFPILREAWRLKRKPTP